MDNLDKNLTSRIGCHCWGTSPESIATLPVAAAAGARWVRASARRSGTPSPPASRGYDFGKGGEHPIDLAVELGMPGDGGS